MELRSLGDCGLKVSKLSLGAMTFGNKPGFMEGVTSDDAEGRRVLDRALDAGVNLVDTANMYSAGESERLLGEWLEGRRDGVLIASKCRFKAGPGKLDQGLSRRHIIQACEASLKRLNTDWIDLYQVHMQDTDVPIEETLRALDDLVSSGKVRYIGCSNYTGYRLVESLWASDKRNFVRYESVQLQYSLVCRDAEREIIPAARANDLGVLAWSPLARGFLSGKYRRDDAPPAGSRLEAWRDSWKEVARPENFDILDVVLEIAAARGAKPSTVALAWALQKPFMTSLIVGARTVQQLEDNLLAARFELSAEETARLDDVSTPAWGYPYAFIGARQEW